MRQAASATRGRAAKTWLRAVRQVERGRGKSSEDGARDGRGRRRLFVYDTSSGKTSLPAVIASQRETKMRRALGAVTRRVPGVGLVGRGAPSDIERQGLDGRMGRGGRRAERADTKSAQREVVMAEGLRRFERAEPLCASWVGLGGQPPEPSRRRDAITITRRWLAGYTLAALWIEKTPFFPLPLSVFAGTSRQRTIKGQLLEHLTHLHGLAAGMEASCAP